MKSCDLNTCKEKTTKKFCSEKCRGVARRLATKTTPPQKTPKPKVVKRPTKKQPPSSTECYLDGCNEPVTKSKIIDHPDLRKLLLTLRVEVCLTHEDLLTSV